MKRSASLRQLSRMWESKAVFNATVTVRWSAQRQKYNAYCIEQSRKLSDEADAAEKAGE